MLGTTQIHFATYLLKLAQNWLDNQEIHNPKIARLVCKLIPAQCPFKRTIKLFNRTIIQIPPLCSLNPLYYQLISLRFRCLCFLADEYGEDVTIYL